MARLPRLVLPGTAHTVMQRGSGGSPVVHDARDRQAWLEALAAAAEGRAVAVHAFAIGEAATWLLATPHEATALGALVQDLGRRYVAGFNRRHARRGPLWDGRFRAAALEAGPWVRFALAWIDAGADLVSPPAEVGTTPAGAGWHSSAPHRTGAGTLPWLTDPPEFWALGNTPFEREAAWRRVLAEPLPAPQRAALMAAATGGWALGSPAFLRRGAAVAGRPLVPRPRGRPRAAAGTPRA
jgi:putative transposase